VVDLNILKETVRVRIPKGDATEQKDYPMDQVQRLHPAQRNKNEENRKPTPAPEEEAALGEENSVLAAEEDYIPEEEMLSEEVDEGITESADEADLQEEIPADEEE